MLVGNTLHHHKELAFYAAVHNNSRSPSRFEEPIMKKSIALLCFALCASAGPTAQAADNDHASCAQLSSDIAARSALFVKVADAAPALTDVMLSAPAGERQVGHDKTLALHNLANEIWSLRTRMAYLDCTQARTFAY
jgi:hypothetical protein